MWSVINFHKIAKFLIYKNHPMQSIGVLTHEGIKFIFIFLGTILFFYFVTSAGNSPVINEYTPADSYQSILDNQSIYFNITNCSDVEGDDLTYMYLFGGDVASSESNFTFNGSFYGDGVYEISAYCLDNNSENDSVNWEVEVNTTSNSKLFVLFSDTHYEDLDLYDISNQDYSEEDINYTTAWIETKNPDFLFHVGDITRRGYHTEVEDAVEGFEELVENTNIENIWFTFGGNHDAFNSAHSHWEGAFFQRERNSTSLWYTIKEGNNVFIFVSLIQDRADWESGWGGYGISSHFIPQNKLNWLESQLVKYNDTENNIFVITHTPIVNTNSYTGSWAQMERGPWINTSNQLLDLFEEYRVDVFIHGHVHTDPNSTYSSNENVSAGYILINGFRDDLPNTTFLHVPDIDWHHGSGYAEDGDSSYPSVMYFKMIEGNNYFDLRATRTDTNSSVYISYNNGSDANKTLRIPLSYPITGMNSSNEIDFFEQDWDVWEYSIEDVDFQWYKDSEGFRLNQSSWISSRWDLWSQQKINSFEINSTGSDSNFTNLFYCSNDNMNSWGGPYSSASDLGNCRWVQVNTTFSGSSTIYVYEMTLGISPAINLNSPTNNFATTNGAINFNYSVEDINDVQNCSLIINDIVKETVYNVSKNSSHIFQSSLGEGSYYWYINCTGSENSPGKSERRLLTISSNANLGGSGTGTFNPSQENLKNGYNVKVREKQKIEIHFENSKKEIEIKSSDKEKIVLSFENQDYEISENSSGKIDFDDDGIYDLEIFNNGYYSNGISDLEFKLIHEEISSEKEETQSENSIEENNLSFWKKIWNFLKSIFYIWD